MIGVVGVGALAAPLLARAQGTGLHMVKGPDITVLLGPAEELPFLEVLYSTPAEMHNNHMGSAMDSLSTILLRSSSAAARR